MLLNIGPGFADVVRMNQLATSADFDIVSDQGLVDLYTEYAPTASRQQITADQISYASGAAYCLETRGYIEQAGVWLHSRKPALQATA